MACPLSQTPVEPSREARDFSHVRLHKQDEIEEEWEEHDQEYADNYKEEPYYDEDEYEL